MISAFGTDSIRHFPDNVADMGQCATRDFEDMLQVSTVIPS